MTLSGLAVKKRYRSSDCNLVTDFYIPCLSNSILYQRAVGYFTSGSLAHAAKGLAHFIRTNGTMRLVAGPVLTAEDVNAINEGYLSRDHVVLENAIKALEGPLDQRTLSRLSCLSALVAAGRLEIRLAYKTALDGKIVRGIYHEKIGIFTDNDNNKVAFIGSPNETTGGLVDNFESVSVFRSWADPEGRVDDLDHDFENLWNNSTPGLSVIPFPEAAREKLIKIRQPGLEESDPDELTEVSPFPHIPIFNNRLSARDYQSEAITRWTQNRCRGILKMATGTGKTKTAMFAIPTILSIHQELLVVVLVPYKHLAEQWGEECKNFGIPYAICSSDYPSWRRDAGDLRMRLVAKNTNIAFLIATYDTFGGNSFQESYMRFPQAKWLIADEVHHMGARSNQKSLDSFICRLGLSATPERMFDEIGTEWLLSNIGPIVFTLDLSSAIPEFLCPYDYHLHVVEFTRQEQEDYREVMEDISTLCARGASVREEDPDHNERLGPLLRRRLEIIGGAFNKLAAVEAIVTQIKQVEGQDGLRYSLFYASSRLFSEMHDLLGNKLGIKISKFTFEETAARRKEIIDDFEQGRIDAILAKKCLDEGMDIPATRTAYILASSSNPMEFVQRRGRVLRKSKGKEFASIHDFFTMPREDAHTDEYDTRLVERELKRALEFARTARNAISATTKLRKIQQRYNLLHL